MRLRARSGLLALLVAASSLVVGGPARAGVLEPTAPFAAGASGTPGAISPLTQTAAGLTYSDGLRTWVKRAGTSPAQMIDRPGHMYTAGDLVVDTWNRYTTVSWRTIADGTWRTHTLPTNSSFEAATPRGYIARRGDGPYDLLHVDLLAGGTVTTVGTIAGYPGVVSVGPLGIVVRDLWADVDVYRYYAFAATGGLGRPLAVQDTWSTYCDVTTRTHVHCEVSGDIIRAPLDGRSSTVLAANAIRLSGTTTDLLYTARSADGEQIVLKRWGPDQVNPSQVLDGTFGLSGKIGVAAGARTAVVQREGPVGTAGIWSVPLDGGTPTIVHAAPPLPRVATEIALGPGGLAWSDNHRLGGAVWTRPVSPSGSLLDGAATRVASGTTGERIRVGAGRATLEDPHTGATQLIESGRRRTVDGTGPRLELSGDRLLHRTWAEGADDPVWQLRDLRTDEVTALPDALDHDLWGERLVRLERNGRITLHDLRTGAAAVQVRAPSAAPPVSGSVHVAGDVVAWDVRSESASGEIIADRAVRDLATTAPPKPLPVELAHVEDLSTGYVLGQHCAATCALSAVAVAGRAVTTLAEDHPADTALDGNVAAAVDRDGRPMVWTLPGYADVPRLLASPAATTVASPNRPWRVRVLTSRVLTACAVEMRNGAGVLVRSLDCRSQQGAARPTWDGRGASGSVLPSGSYRWRIVGATGAEKLVDYDGTTTALSGTLRVSTDGVAPTVAQRAPAPSGTGFSQSADVTVTFDEPVAGVSASTFTLRSSTGSVVPATVTYDPGTRTAELNPGTALAADAHHRVTLTGGATAIRDGVGNALTTTSWTFTTGPRPTLVETSPAHGARGVSRDVQPRTVFSEDVEGLTTVELHSPDGTPVDVGWTVSTRAVTLSPSQRLAPDTRYTVRLVGGAHGVRDRAGNHLAATSWSFITGPAPALTALGPVDGATRVPTTDPVVASFTEPVRGVDGSTFWLRAADGSAIPASVTLDAAGTKAVLDPLGTLRDDTRYTATVTGGADAIRDLAGNPLARRSWAFSTGVAPTVTGSSPAPGTTGVSRSAAVVATFDEPVTSVSDRTVKLLAWSEWGSSPVAAVVTYDAGRRKVTLDPTRSLAGRTRYTLELTGGTTGIRDAGGNPLQTSSWSFRTGD